MGKCEVTADSNTNSRLLGGYTADTIDSGVRLRRLAVRPMSCVAAPGYPAVASQPVPDESTTRPLQPATLNNKAILKLDGNE